MSTGVPTTGGNKSAYILFTESVIYFTPSAVTLNDHEHGTISVSAPAAITKRNHSDALYGRRETTVRIPYDFTGKFIVTVATDYTKRQKNAARINRLGVTVKNGSIIGVVNLDSNRVPFIEISFPSGYWGELGMNWEANDWEVWVDLPTGWDEE